MINEIHQSSLGMAFRCGEQFRRRYIENEIIPPSVAAGRGTGVHAGNKANLRQKIVSGEDLPESDILDATRDGFVHALRNGVYLPQDEISEKNRIINNGLNDAIRCAKLYKAEVAHTIKPKAVEEPFRVDVGLPLFLGGTMDYQETPRVGDLKTAGLKWQEGRIEKEIQPVFYSYVHEKQTGVRPEFVYHILIARRGKEGNPTSTKLQEQSITCTDNHYHALFAKFRMFIKMLETGTFLPANPSSWWCSPKWCGYFQTCPYVGNSLPKKWI
jgi:hypothetical protein